MSNSYFIGKSDCGINKMSAYIVCQTRVSSFVSAALFIDPLKPIKIDLIDDKHCKLLIERISEKVK